jgi:hypothetical protein
MFNSPLKLFVSCAIVVLVYCTSPGRVDAAVFRDRASFNAASQNLHTIDFESGANVPDGLGFVEIDGVYFRGFSLPTIVSGQNGNKLLNSSTVGEITRLLIFLPPGTTAVGCDQFNRPMIVSISTGSSGESVTMDPSDNSNFVGFVSDQPIQSLVITLDFPEPTPDALIDNLSYGQRRVGNEPPVPQLLMTSTGRAMAVDSVTTTSEPFHVLAPHLLATDGHTRITLFIVGVLLQPADLQFVTVQAEDSQAHLVNLPVEATALVKNVSWMSQVTVRVPDALAGVGNVNIKVTVHGIVSNAAPLQIQ